MRQLYMIACVSKDLGIGNQNQLLWKIPEDMHFFRETTTGYTVVMGGNTFRSIGKTLPNRHNIVLSRSEISDPDVTWYNDMNQLLAELEKQTEPAFIIGGVSLYAKFLPEAHKIYLTEVDATRPADTYFPEFDQTKYHRKVLQSGEYNGINYDMVEYTKKEEHE